MKSMKSLKLRLFSVISLALVAAVTVGVFFGLNFASADRSVNPVSLTCFNPSAQDAEIWSHKEAGADEGEDAYYTMFVVTSDKGSVDYRHNLAYSWYYNSNDDEAEDAALTAAEGNFKMSFGFEKNAEDTFDFEKYIITFESQQYTQTNKDLKTTNYLLFFPTSDNRLNAVITDDKDAEHAEDLSNALGAENITVELKQGEKGEFSVTVSDGTATAVGTFENIGGTFAKYSSSTTAPLTPMSFGATFPEDASSVSARLFMRELNGQSFKLRNTPSTSGDHYVSGNINDDTPPVLCLNKGLSFIGLGKEISFDYTVIDVIVNSPQSNTVTSYYMLDKEQAANGDFNAEAYKDEKLFREVTDTQNQYMIPHTSHYKPVNGGSTVFDTAIFDEDLQLEAAVKVLIKLTDTSSTNGQTTYVMLDWYVDEAHKVKINGHDYVGVATDGKGATFAYTDDAAKTSSPESAAWQEKLAKYREAVKDASKGLTAGNKNYFYLPSVEELLGDNATENKDLTYYIYYDNGSRSQVNSKSANALSINLTKADKYVFTIYAADAQGNDMYYYENGEAKTFKTGDIWDMHDDEDKKDYLPWFTFNVDASEITIEEVKEQATAYVGSTYYPESFDINGVSYGTEYKLFLFDSEKYTKEKEEVMTYAKFVELKDSFYDDPALRPYLKEIVPASKLEEGTEEYERFNPYEWNGSSLSFVPQDANTFYLIRCNVSDNDNGGVEDATAYMAVPSAPKVRPIVGEDTWVQDNLASIILLCVAGASLVGIVLILVIKPKKTDDLDEFETRKKK